MVIVKLMALVKLHVWQHYPLSLRLAGWHVLDRALDRDIDEIDDGT
jgi:hypothetical protein